MLKVDSKNTSYSGSSWVNEERIASFSASKYMNNCSISMNIDNWDKYLLNKETVQADFDGFVAEIEEAN